MDIRVAMAEMGRAARDAARVVAAASVEQRNQALVEIQQALASDRDRILAANAQDLEAGRQNGLDAALLDRLAVTPARLDVLEEGLSQVAALPDPIGEISDERVMPSGISVGTMRVPLGVIGMIYESRPNVTIEAASLCLKAGNAVILRGGSEAIHSNTALGASLASGLSAADLPVEAAQVVPVVDRAAVGALLTMPDFIDLVVPRGGKGLIARVQAESRIPVLAHLDGNCHVYVHEAADLEMAKQILLNAKLRRTGICGAAESLLIDAKVADRMTGPLVAALLDAGCAVRGDEAVQKADPRVTPASDEDWSTEYLDAIISAKVVPDLDAAIAHIARYGSHHTDAIVTGDADAAARFLNAVDSAIVMHNASTQFADGGQFGMGAEIGIATGRLHARGPVGVEQLTTFKYQVEGDGQTRP